MTTSNEKAFLDCIGRSEGTYGIGDNGYNVLVGGGLFDSYADHPRIVVLLPKLGIKSSAAGKFQILARYYDAYKEHLGLQDFSPASQDRIAIQMISECHALEDIDQGLFDSAITKCASRWASLPGNNYGQHEQKLSDLRSWFVEYGGVLAG